MAGESELYKQTQKYSGGPVTSLMTPGMNDYYAGNMRMIGSSGGSAGMGRMMYLNGYNQLNTIEEEKHETQNSNYFREGNEESEHLESGGFKDSKILQDTSALKLSPGKSGQDFQFS